MREHAEVREGMRTRAVDALVHHGPAVALEVIEGARLVRQRLIAVDDVLGPSET